MPTCYSKLFLKLHPAAALGREAAKLPSDGTPLPHPQPAEVQNPCYGNNVATRIFLTWFYRLTPKVCTGFPLPYIPLQQLLFCLHSPSPSLLLPSPVLLVLPSAMPSAVGVVLAAASVGSLQLGPPNLFHLSRNPILLGAGSHQTNLETQKAQPDKLTVQKDSVLADNFSVLAPKCYLDSVISPRSCV